MMVVADRLEQVVRMEAALVTRRDSFPPDQRPIGKVATLYSLLPTDQDRKVPVLREIRELITKNALKFLTPAQRREMAKITPPPALAPVGIGDLPEKMAR